MNRPRENDSPPSVLYVGGLGRSGSTLLERACAQIQGVCGAGELVYLWDRGIINNERCGCGEVFGACPFWAAVGDHAFGGWETVDVDRVKLLASRVDDVKYVPRLLFPLAIGGLRSDVIEYLSYYERLVRGIAAVSGCGVVVDSSKITSLAYLLSHSQSLDLRLVHIVRDARAVAYSWTKVVRRPEVTSATAYMPRYSPGYMALLYDGHHVLLELLRMRRVPELLIRYEDFAEDPLGVVAKVAAFIGVSFDPAELRGDADASLHLRRVHTVSGNPSRFAVGDVAVRRDDRWRDEMPAAQRRLVGALTAPVQMRYGYLPDRGPVESRARSLPALPEAPSVWPTVSVVVPTHDRPTLMKRAVRSIVGQDYSGAIEVIVVYDKADPDPEMCSDEPGRVVRVLANDRAPGLAGSRNTGILDAGSELVGFCDDDDQWERSKLTRQVRALSGEPGAEFATTAMVIDYQNRAITRLARTNRVKHQDLVRSRMAMLHSSSFLVRRDAITNGIGLIDETIPQSMAEDWDVLLRAARRHPIVHLDEPLIRVQWGPTSYFADKWDTRNKARLWMLAHHPEICADPMGAGLSYGKLAFGHAMLGNRRAAVTWAIKSLRSNWREPRAYLAMAVASRLVKGQWVVDQLNRRGHGI